MNKEEPKIVPRRTVYVVHKGMHDYSAAEEYGNLHYLCVDQMPRAAVSRMYHTFKEPIDESDKEDYILISGIPTMNVVACVLFAARHGRLNLLIHAPTINAYLLRNMLVPQTARSA